MTEYTILNVNEIYPSSEEWKLFPLVAEACQYSVKRLIEYSAKFYTISWPHIANETMMNIISNKLTDSPYLASEGSVRLYHYTKSNCLSAAFILSTYLYDFLLASLSNGDRIEDIGIELSLLFTKNGLRYFSAHYPVMIEDHHNSECYILSPANAFNEDGTLPELEGVKFDRLSNVIGSRNFDLGLEALCLLESKPGTTTQWKKYPISYDLFENIFQKNLPIDLAKV